MNPALEQLIQQVKGSQVQALKIVPAAEAAEPEALVPGGEEASEETEAAEEGATSEAPAAEEGSAVPALPPGHPPIAPAQPAGN